VKIAAIADLHCRVNMTDDIRTLLKQVQREADVLVLAGDLTDTGLPAEMEVVLKELERLSMPKVAVLGNHDHESDQAEVLANMLRSQGINVLEGTVCEIESIGFVGTKGFCGGFGSHFVQPFGERALKTFIQASISEAVTLENALAKLDCPHKVAVLHYAPVSSTLEGEPLELYPFLGSDRLANAIDRHGADVIFHGHAHHGSPEGQTQGNIPVHNVSRFVRSRVSDRPFCLYGI
jgi:Icc-related predicted phosphoesterase